MTEVASAAPVFALLADGARIGIRPLRAEDAEAVAGLHREMSPENLYLRFFGYGRHLGDEPARRLCRPLGPDHGALGAWLGGELVGVAGHERADGDGAPGVAEIALAVADHMHGRGVGTLLLEHLASDARAKGVRVFRGDVLGGNTAMLSVLGKAGWHIRRHLGDGVVEVTMTIEAHDRDPGHPAGLDAAAERERRAGVEGMEGLLRPRSVAVVGVSRRGPAGRVVLRNLVSAGFGGPVRAVDPHGGPSVAGVPCVASVADLPGPPDLAVLAVPAREVPAAAAECGRRGARALVVLASGLSAPEGRALLAVCHRYGMRLAGPDCIGVADAGIGLDATCAARPAAAGRAGVVVQSGGVGMALLEHLSRLGVGLSSFASVGDGYDVGSDDMLLWWESDGRTGLGVLYVESFGDPRRFARTARRVGRRMPLMTVVTGGRTPGPRAAASRIGTGAMLAVTREALFGQAGIIATHGLGELVGVAALLAHQPVPAGPRVAIVSNGGAAGALAAEACADAGLSVPELGEGTRARLAALLPGDAACAGPVDTTAAVDPSRFRRALDLVAGDDSVDGLLALVAPTALGDLTDLTAAIGRTRKPTVAVVLGQAEAVTVRGDAIPSYAYPEDAARALSHAWSYGRWRARAPGAEPRLADLCPAGARDVVEDFLVRRPEGGWLRSAEAMRLLGCYRVPLVPWRPAGSEEETVRAAAELGGRVALKGDVPGAVHKSEVGGVRLDLFGEGEVRRAYRRLCACFGDGRTAVIVQRMAKDGIEVLCGVSQDPVFGPLLTFGLGGAATEGLGDRTVRLVPLTDVDAAELVRGALCASPLLGHRDRPAAGSAALEEALLRLSRLAADLPEMAELELDPLIARPDGAVAVDVRVRVTPVRRWDPYLRRLR